MVNLEHFGFVSLEETGHGVLQNRAVGSTQLLFSVSFGEQV
jgi:hypothetical protein